LQNHFELFGLSPGFLLEKEILEKAYRDIQSRVHPDRFAQAGDAERRASLQWATRVNEAYRTLKDPVQRARHILDLQGVDVAFETDTAMPAEFLTQQLEFRESLEAAVENKDTVSLDGLRKMLLEQRQALQEEVQNLIDTRKDYKAAAGPVRKLMFIHRLDEEVDAAYGEIE
jgi:molecular chaperone HscB